LRYASTAFTTPTKFVGPVYAKETADTLAAENGWTFRQDGQAWRRVVPSPAPRRVLEIEPITWLLDRGAVVICAGGVTVQLVAGIQTLPLVSSVRTSKGRRPCLAAVAR
jgi:carbamate kinase